MKKKTAMDSLSRRELLQYGMGVAGSMLLPHPWILRAEAATSGQHTTVLLFLRGAMDPLSLIAPLAQSPHRSDYDLARPRIGLKKEGLLRVSRESSFGVHPSARELKELMDAGKMKFLLGCGSLNPTTSHFSQQDNIERGYGATPISGLSTGMLNRALGEIQKSATLPSVTIGTVLDTSLQGPQSALAVANLTSTGVGNAKSIPGVGVSQRINEGWVKSDQGTWAENSQRTHAARAERALAAIQGASTVSVALSPLNGSMEDRSAHYAGYHQLQNALRLMKADPMLRFITASVGGSWDDHFNIGANGGSFDARVARLSRALGTFMKDLQNPANGLAGRVTVVVLSEFGRNVSENNSLGLDHGRGGAAMVLDSSMSGGSPIVAERFTLSKSNAEIARNVLPVEYDYRQVLAEVLMKRMGAKNIATVFPGLIPQSYSLLR